MIPTFDSSLRGFRIETSFEPDEVRKKLRENLADWYQIRSAPRGIVFGPIIWLWHDINSSEHATLFALVTRQGWGSKIVGTTNYFLALFGFLFAILAAGYWGIAGLLDGSLYAMGVIPILAGLLALLAVIVFLARRLDHANNPAVRLMRDLFVAQDDGTRRLADFEQMQSTNMIGDLVEMDLLGSHDELPLRATPERLHEMLRAMEAGKEDFVILQKGDLLFMQVAPEAYGYRLELRTEADDWPRCARQADRKKNTPIGIEQVAKIMADYLHGNGSGPDILWD